MAAADAPGRELSPGPQRLLRRRATQRILADDLSFEEDEQIKKERQEKWEKRRQQMPWKVEVQTLDYHHFKNRYSLDDGLAIIEVLQGHHSIYNEVWHENNRRRLGFIYPETPVELENEGTWIQRVRIQSPELLLLLSRLTGHRDLWAKRGPRVFFRPFTTLYYYLPEMKECLALLESRWGGNVDESHQDPIDATQWNAKFKSSGHKDISEPEDESFRIRTPAESVIGPIADSVTALRHVRLFVNFMDTEIVPLWKRAAGTTHRKIAFADLWMSYQPGELLYVPSPSETTQDQIWPEPLPMSQNIWRLHTISRDQFQELFNCDMSAATGQELDLWSYYIDFNGVSYEPYTRRFSIKAYEGLRDITTMQIYPLRFHKDAEKLLESRREVGQLFQKALMEKHLYYEGWTLTHEPTQSPQLQDRGNSEHIEGQVMIDFVEGHKSDSDLASKSDQTLTGWSANDWPEGEDSVAINHWYQWTSEDEEGSEGEAADNGHEKTCEPGFELMKEESDCLQLYEDFAGIISDHDLETNDFLRSYMAGNAMQITTEDLVLLPGRVVAYAFRDRRFVRLDVKYLQPIPPSENVFKNLRINEEHKRMVRALVKTHFQKQRLNLDLIRGKGSGLVILLHGAPGVGKTATAEAVAQANKKPLFSITCGDLGFQAQDVETNLKEIFRLAHRWDCVLLLDEADIFLTRRNLSDLVRNALVSVFLRMLEYYSGILFLTTNRVGIIDEAFKSRIHVSLYYQPLDREQTLAIFRNNIRKLRKVEAEKDRQRASDPDGPQGPILDIDEKSILHYAAWHYDTHVQHRWNGRQIRNAFQIAYSFAHFDIQNGPDTWQKESEEEGDTDSDEGKQVDFTVTNPVLDYRHFLLVADTIRRFDNYLWETTGETEEEQAFNWSLRADDYNPDEWDDGPVYHPMGHQPQRRGYGPSSRGSMRGRGGPRGGAFRGSMPQGGRAVQRERSPVPEYQPPLKAPLSQQQGGRAKPMPGAEVPSYGRRFGPGANSDRPRAPPQRRSEQQSPAWNVHSSKEGHFAYEEDYEEFEEYEEEGYDEYSQNVGPAGPARVGPIRG
ncbi:ATP-binding protein [Aspergillus novofumigatus IBT 16806]|uniref:Putative AAA family ATPase n=1 Tax=Aspergillus novofumigatus (strain IBT 16806) TaxID=1392255 RepID=A0A2I1CF30_ASPN1|nr:putative AAA family ATPase [Aspergillus novofumigatus IBT 16806]PKX96232.1 putative AAA family ATPase [Aspergillus novofumigatus IBT 16806]